MLRHRRYKRASYRPAIEVLEGRWVPTTLTPTTFADGGLGSGSLRDAVLHFNADAGTDDHIIQLAAGSSGDNPTIIDASQLQDRVFEIVTPGTQVVFQDLIIQGGLAQDDGTEGALAGTTDALGGGILNNGGNVTLDNVLVQNNVAPGADAAVLRA